MQFKPYTEYKASGVEWLGNVPSHWEIAQIKKSISSSQNGIWGNDPKEDKNDIVCLRVADFDRTNFIISQDNLTLRNIIPKEQENRLVKNGDLLIEKSGGGDKQPVGTVVAFYGDFPAVCSNFIAKITIKENMDLRFLTYLHSCLHKCRIVFKAIKQTTGIQNLDLALYFSEKVAFPPLSEQTQIAQFLDHQMAKIANLIEKQTALIALLEEQRNSILAHCVTKGLNPNAKMKKSGIDWLGDVPEHWGVVRFSHIFEENKRRNKGLKETNVLSLSYGNIREKDLETEKGLLPESFETYQIVYPKDIIFRFTDLQNDKRSLRSAISNYQGIITSAYLCVRNKTGDANYFNYLFRDYDLRKVFYAMGDGLRQSLKISELNKMLLTIPPIEEQQQIADYIRTEHQRIDELINKQKALIENLKSYRTSLISYAVTGKMDVRDIT